MAEAVIFEIGADASSFGRTMAGLKAETSKAAASVDSAFSQSFDRLAASASSAGNAISVGVTAPLVAVGVLAGNTAIKFTKLYETTMIVFESMLGGKEAASALYGSLLDIAKGSTFAQETFLECGKKLVGMGVDADTTKAILQATTDAVAGFGGSAENIKSVTDAFAKMSNSGRLSMEEVNTLSDNGVQALKILANQYGVSTDEMRAMISDGAVPAKEAIEQLTSGIENGTDGAAGMTQAMSGMAASLKAGSLTGAFDGVNSAIRAFSLSLIGINPTLKETDAGYAESQERIEQLTAAVVTISEIIPLMAKMFSGVTDAIGRVLDVLVGANVKLDESAGKWEDVNGALGEFKRYLRDTPTEQLALIGNLLVAIAVTGPALKLVSVAMGALSTATAVQATVTETASAAHMVYNMTVAAGSKEAAAATATGAALNAVMAANPALVLAAGLVGLVAAYAALSAVQNAAMEDADKLTVASQQQKDRVNELTAEYYGLMLTQGETADATLAAKAALDEETAAFEESRQTIGELAARCRDTTAAHNALAASMDESEAQAGKQAGAILSLSGQVAELAGVENRSASQKSMLAAKVKALNDAYGEEVVVYDETTDSANMTADAIQALGKAEADRVRANAAIDRYTQLMQDSVAVSDELAVAQENLEAASEGWGIWIGDFPLLADPASVKYHELKEAVDGLTGAQGDNAERLKQAQAEIEEHAVRQGALAEAVKEVEANTLSAEEAARKYSDATGFVITAEQIRDEQDRKLAEAQREVAEATEKAAEELEDARQAVSDYAAEHPGFQEALEASGYTLSSFADALLAQGQTMDDAAKQIDGYRDRITSAFDEIAWKQEESIDRAAEIYLKNLEATRNWSANLSYLANESGLSFNEGFVAAVRDGGIEEWGQVIDQLAAVARDGGTILINDTAYTAQEFVDLYAAAPEAAREQMLAEAVLFGEVGAASSQALAEGANSSLPVVEEASAAQAEAARVEASQVDNTETGAAAATTLASGMSAQTGAVGASSSALAASLQTPLAPVPAFARKMADDAGAGMASGINASVGAVQGAAGNVAQAGTIAPGAVDNAPGGASSAESFAAGQDSASGDVAASSDDISKLAADHMSSATADARQAGASMAGDHFASGVSAGRDPASAEARSLSKLVADHMSSANGDAWWAGRNMAAGMARGISAGASMAVNAAARMAADSVTAAKAALDEHSPSRVFRRIGEFASLGYAAGVGRAAGEAAAATRSMAERSIEAARGRAAELPVKLSAASLDAFQAKRSSVSAFAAPSPAGAPYGGGEVARELRQVRESIEDFRRGLGRTIEEHAPTKVDAYVENPREIAYAMDGR